MQFVKLKRHIYIKGRIMEILITETISLKWQDYWELTKILLKGEW